MIINAFENVVVSLENGCHDELIFCKLLFRIFFYSLFVHLSPNASDVENFAIPSQYSLQYKYTRKRNSAFLIYLLFTLWPYHVHGFFLFTNMRLYR